MSERPARITETDIARLAGTVTAPESLHRRVQEMVDEAQRRAPARRRVGWAMPARRRALAIAGALAAIAAVLVGALPGGGSRPLNEQTAAALALAPATLPAPRESPDNHHQLAVSVDGVPFPYWEGRFGWRGSGARTDELGGRGVTTVFYSDAHGQRIGYAIASGRGPTSLVGSAITRWGVTYRLSRQDGANVIAWRRDGHLCVIAGRGVGTSTLVHLASWGQARARVA